MRNNWLTAAPIWSAIALFCLLVALCGFCDSLHAQSLFERRSVQRNGSGPRTPSPTAANEATSALGQTRGKVVPAGVSNPILDPTSALGQALAACDKDAAVQDAFILPALKGELTLDRCYKGRAHFICVSTALIAEAQSLTKSFRRIVEAKYPDLNNIDSICGLNSETLDTDITGSQEFIKRFSVLKSQYETTSRCAASVEQTFKDVVLADMAQAPDILKSMTESIESDMAKTSKVQNQLADLAQKMEASKKAMITLDKVHRAMCVMKGR